MNKPGDYFLSSLDKGTKGCCAGCLVLIILFIGLIFLTLI